MWEFVPNQLGNNESHGEKFIFRDWNRIRSRRASIVTVVLFRVAGSKVVTGAQRQARILTGFVWISWKNKATTVQCHQVYIRNIFFILHNSCKNPNRIQHASTTYPFSSRNYAQVCQIQCIRYVLSTTYSVFHKLDTYLLIVI